MFETIHNKLTDMNMVYKSTGITAISDLVCLYIIGSELGVVYVCPGYGLQVDRLDPDPVVCACNCNRMSTTRSQSSLVLTYVFV